MVQYSGKWKRKILCKRCKKWKDAETKYTKVCKDCWEDGQDDAQSKRDYIKAFKKKNKLPWLFRITFKDIKKIELGHDTLGEFIKRGEISKKKLDSIVLKGGSGDGK